VVGYSFDDFGDGLYEAFEQDFDFALYEIAGEVGEIGLVLLCSGYFVSEFL
jgi:hypothetical protein